MTESFDKRVNTILREVLRGSKKRNTKTEAARYGGVTGYMNTSGARLLPGPGYADKTPRFRSPQYKVGLENPGVKKTKADPNAMGIAHNKRGRGPSQKLKTGYNSKRPNTNNPIVIAELPDNPNESLYGMNPYQTNLNHAKAAEKLNRRNRKTNQ